MVYESTRLDYITAYVQIDMCINWREVCTLGVKIMSLETSYCRKIGWLLISNGKVYWK